MKERVKVKSKKVKGWWTFLNKSTSLLPFTFYPLPVLSHLLPFIFLLLPFPLSSVHAVSDNAGTKNGAFLKLAADARGTVMGDTLVALAEGTEGMRWNPASLGYLQHRELSMTHVQYYQEIQIENVGFGYPLDNSALAANAFYLTSGNLDGRDTLGRATGDFKFYDLVGSLGYGRHILTRADGADVSIGAAIKVVQEAIADQQFQNPAMDAGILISPWENVKAGMAVHHLAASKANFPREITGGAAYTVYRTFTGALALRYTDDAPIRFSVGGEYKLSDYQTIIRAGYQTHDPLDNSIDSDISFLRNASLAGLKMGVGFDYRLPFLQSLLFQLDYAMAPFGSLGISHTVTLKTKW